jgi:hypothetical protein
VAPGSSGICQLIEIGNQTRCPALSPELLSGTVPSSIASFSLYLFSAAIATHRATYEFRALIHHPLVTLYGAEIAMKR